MPEHIMSLEEVQRIQSLTHVWTGQECHMLCTTVEALYKALRDICGELDDTNGWLPTALEPQGEFFETAVALLAQLEAQGDQP